MMETHSDFQEQYQDELNGKNKTASTVYLALVYEWLKSSVSQ